MNFMARIFCSFVKLHQQKEHLGSYNKLGEHWLGVDAKCYPHEELSSINNQDGKFLMKGWEVNENNF